MLKLRALERNEELSPGEKVSIVRKVDALFGLNLTAQQSDSELSEEITLLLADRIAARSNRDFLRSDQLRDELARLGIEVRDTSAGQSWSRISLS